MSMKKKYVPYFFLLPSLIGVSIFAFIPFIDIMKRSLYDSSNTVFQKADNYQEVWNSGSYLLSLRNTFLFMGVSITCVMAISIILAVIFTYLKKVGDYLKTIYLIPLAIPVAGISLYWNLFFDNKGILNGIIDAVGGETINWFSTKYSFLILVLLFIWKNLGFSVLLWMIGISSIPAQINESAQIDGANQVKCFIYIIFPNTKSTLYTSVLLLIINSFKIYRESYLLAGDYPHESMYMVQNILNNWFRNYDLDKMSAGTVICVFILCVIILLLNKKLDL